MAAPRPLRFVRRPCLAPCGVGSSSASLRPPPRIARSLIPPPHRSARSLREGRTRWGAPAPLHPLVRSGKWMRPLSELRQRGTPVPLWTPFTFVAFELRSEPTRPKGATPPLDTPTQSPSLRDVRCLGGRNPLPPQPPFLRPARREGGRPPPARVGRLGTYGSTNPPLLGSPTLTTLVREGFAFRSRLRYSKRFTLREAAMKPYPFG